MCREIVSAIETPTAVPSALASPFAVVLTLVPCSASIVRPPVRTVVPDSVPR